jgi:hypothetical protein
VLDCALTFDREPVFGRFRQGMAQSLAIRVIARESTDNRVAFCIGRYAVGANHRGRRLPGSDGQARYNDQGGTKQLPVVVLLLEACLVIEDDLLRIIVCIHSWCRRKVNCFFDRPKSFIEPVH